MDDSNEKRIQLSNNQFLFSDEKDHSPEQIRLVESLRELMGFILSHNHYVMGGRQLTMLVHITSDKLAVDGHWTRDTGITLDDTMFKESKDGFVRPFGGPKIRINSTNMNLESIGDIHSIIISGHSEPNQADSQPNFYRKILELDEDPELLDRIKMEIVGLNLSDDDEEELELTDAIRDGVNSIKFENGQITAQCYGSEIELSPVLMIKLAEKFDQLRIKMVKMFGEDDDGSMPQLTLTSGRDIVS